MPTITINMAIFDGDDVDNDGDDGDDYDTVGDCDDDADFFTYTVNEADSTSSAIRLSAV